MFGIGAAFMCYGGSGFAYNILPLGLDLDGDFKTASLAIWGGAWDSSSLIFLFYYYMYTNYGLTYQTFFYYYSLIGVVIILYAIFYPVVVQSEDETILLDGSNDTVMNEKPSSLLKICSSPDFITLTIKFSLVTFWYTV